MSARQTLDRQLRGLANLMTLAEKARRSETTIDLGYVAVNDTAIVCPYAIAGLWLARSNRIISVSGIPEPSAQAAFTTWSRRVATVFYQPRSPNPEPEAFHKNHERIGSSIGEWPSAVPECGAWLPLIPPNGSVIGVMVLFRDTAFSKEELRVLARWMDVVAHAFVALGERRRPRRRARAYWIFRRVAIVAVLAGIVASMWLPITQNAVAPVEIVPRNPIIVRSPLDGVIDTVHVSPQTPVEAGDLLITLDDLELRARVAVAERDLDVSRAQFRQAQQAAIRDRDAQAELPILQARIRQHQADVTYLSSLLARVSIAADGAGVAVIQDKEDLIGKPVRIGEQLLRIADPSLVEAEIRLPVASDIPLPERAAVELFLNIQPERTWAAELLRSDYHATVGDDGALAYRIRARLVDEDDQPVLGWRGTARLNGETVPLYYYLFRRPFAQMRQWIGM